ncbi:hypothetical protein BGZ51_007151, partial [Haplosporangium sp. Z 767]
STEWKSSISQGIVALKSARTSVVRALADFTVVIDQLRMNRIRLKLITTIQRASVPGIMGVDAILQAQKEEEEEAIAAAAREDSDLDSDKDSDSNPGYNQNQNKEDDDGKQDDLSMATATSTFRRGYVPSPELLRYIIPGTQATPMAMSAYMQHVFDQVLDEMALKESILEALETIAEIKDSGEDELPPLLDQQLTNMLLLWELEPYLETVPERNEIEGALGVHSWQMEKVK